MAMSSKLTTKLLDSTNDTQIYNVPANTEFQGNIFITSSDSCVVRVGLVPSGETYGQEHDITRVQMEANSSISITGISLPTGASIYANATVADKITIVVTGLEIT